MYFDSSITKIYFVLFFFFQYSITKSQIQTSSPAYLDGVWYSNGKTVTGFSSGNPIVIDGVFDDFVWNSKAGYNETNNEFPNSSKLLNVVNEGNTLTLTGIQSVNTNEENVTFGVAFDNNYLYLAIAVKSKSVADLTSLSSSAEILATHLYIGANNENRNYSKNANGDFFLDPFEKSTLNLDKDFYVKLGPTLNSKNNYLTQIEESLLSKFGNLSEKDIKAYIQKTEDGYNLEAAIDWKSINTAYINPITGEYNDSSDMPRDGKTYPFDIGFSVPKSDLSSSKGKLMWNSCCLDRNGIESIHWGTLVLSSNLCCSLMEGISILGANINGNNPQNIKVITNPVDGDKNIRFQVLTDACKPVIKVTENGLIIPLNNGLATVIGTSLSNLWSSNANSVTSAVITVSNMGLANAISITPTTITYNWGKVYLKSSISPSNANQDVKWSVVEGINFIDFNSVAGIAISKSISPSSSVILKATSEADCNLTATGILSIIDQEPITASNLEITLSSNKTCNSNRNAITVVGYTPTTPQD